MRDVVDAEEWSRSRSDMICGQDRTGQTKQIGRSALSNSTESAHTAVTVTVAFMATVCPTGCSALTDQSISRRSA